MTIWREGRSFLIFESRMNKIGPEISVMNVILNKLLAIFSVMFLPAVCQYHFVWTATVRQVFNEIHSFWFRSIDNEPNIILMMSVAQQRTLRACTKTNRNSLGPTFISPLLVTLMKWYLGYMLTRVIRAVYPSECTVITQLW